MIEQATTDTHGSLGFAAPATGNATVSRATYNSQGQILLHERYEQVTAAAAQTPSALPGVQRPSLRQSFGYATVTDANHTRGDLKTLTLEWPSLNPPQPAQTTIFTQYNARGQPLRFQSPDGSVTTLAYNARGQLTQHTVLPAAGNLQTTQYQYDAAGQLKKATLPDLSWVSFAYDAAHRLTAITDSAGNRVGYTLDAAGLISSEKLTGDRTQLSTREAHVYQSLRTPLMVTPANIAAMGGFWFGSPPDGAKQANTASQMTTTTARSESPQIDGVAVRSAAEPLRTADEAPDVSMCSTYEQLHAKSKCRYDREAAAICRGDFTAWSLPANFLVRGCTLSNPTPNKTRNCIRRCLVREHLAAQKEERCFKGNDGCTQLPCVSRACIHSYHVKCFDECDVTPFCYGGVWIPFVPWGVENEQ